VALFILASRGGNLFRIISYALAFLVCAVMLAKVRSRTTRQTSLLIASSALYLAWGVWFAAVLLASIVTNYLIGEWLRRKGSGVTLSIGIFLNVALLTTFKYLPEAAVHLPFSSLHRFAHLAMPLGISFWTFQAMSYLFDVYQGDDVEPSFFEFALYMVFFPVTIAGPICRMSEMLPQFRSERVTRVDDIVRGCQRIATGVLMMQLAKLLGLGILGGDGIASGFDRVTNWSGPDVWCLAFGYGLQLFFDFAGYSHIAIGVAQALGFTIPENFARPFESTSPSIFWTRWHMSLSFWIRDYVFFPLMRLRREAWWRNLSLLIAMVLFGLWHKASILFLLWGAYHGLLLLLHRQVEGLQRRFDWTPPTIPWTAFSWVSTIGLVNLGWIFFRANSLHQARQMLVAILSPATYQVHFVTGSLYWLVLALAVGYTIVLFTIDRLSRYSTDRADAQLDPVGPPTGPMALLARWRWFWLPPLYALALLFVLIATLSRGPSAAQMMYSNF
jgi:alginate O-acetyltransferase complex protein AlgI